MAKYGMTAVRAAELAIGDGIDPLQAWRQAAAEVFPGAPSSRTKGCPKNAFLGLCEEGLIKGISKGNYTNSVMNKSYALAGLAILQNNPSMASDPKGLWSLAMNGRDKVANGQMEVVIALWQEGLLLSPDSL